MAKMINAIGLYTEKQMDEKRERIDELWKMLNTAHAFMHVQALYLRMVNDENHKFPNGQTEPAEFRRMEINRIADEMADLAGRVEAVLTDYKRADWS